MSPHNVFYVTWLMALLVSSSLELASKNIVCGSVRMVYALIYTLFLVRAIFASSPGQLYSYMMIRVLLCRSALIYSLSATKPHALN